MHIIVLNSTNLVNDGQNNKLVYKFPNSVLLTNKYIAVTSISMYYSWFNITSALNNNKFTYSWTSGAITTTYTVTLPDGIYDINTINNYFQYTCIQNGTYWISPNGDYVYPLEILLNTTRYAVQINTYLIPTALPAGYSIPANFAGWPVTTQNSVITIPANFSTIVGYVPGFASNANLNNLYVPPTSPYVSKLASGTLSYISTTAPNVTPNNNVLFSLSNINSPYSKPSTILYSLNPNVNIGEQIFVIPPNFAWVKLVDGTYNDLRLTLLDTNLNPLIVNDSNMTILLAIRDKDEVILGAK